MKSGWKSSKRICNDMKSHLISLSLCIVLAACSCGGKDPVEPGNEQPVETTTGDVTAYITTADKSKAFVTDDKIAFAAETSAGGIQVTSDRYQTVQGFGTAISQATCYNLLRMSQEDRTKFLTEIFSRKEGLGSSLIRVCIGGSDFSLDEFTWCDKEGMDHFEVHDSDKRYLFPILDEIFAINPDVKIIASPWSCPRWMKRAPDSEADFNSWTSGRLKPACYADYALYFVKWIQEMESRGYPIYAITVQNEPLNKGNSMSMYMSWQEQRDFIKTALGPAFEKAGIKTKILLYDHNYDQSSYPLNILKDADAAKYAAGTAWHSYGGSVSVLDNVFSSFPDKEIYFTEASIGTWNHQNFSDNFTADFREEFIGVLMRGGSGSVLWNLMLDKDGKPYRPGGCSTCYGAVTIGPTYSYNTIVRNTHYYFVAQCSKVIQPGAVRIGTSGSVPADILHAAFRNPDGSYAWVVLNQGSSPAYLTFTSGHTFQYNIPARSIVSFTWKD